MTLFPVLLGTAGFSRGAEIEVGTLYHSNLSRAADSADREDDVLGFAEASISRAGQLARDWRCDARGLLLGEQALEYGDFSRVGVGADAGLTRKWGLGPFAPRLRLGLDAEQSWFGDADRDRWALRPGLLAAKRVAERVELEAFYRYEEERADVDLYSASAHAAGLTVRAEVGDRWTLLAGYRFRNGDVVSYSSSPSAYMADASTAWVSALETFDRPMWAYRIEAESHGVELGGALDISERLRLRMSYAWTRTERGPLSYDTSVLHLSLNAAF